MERRKIESNNGVGEATKKKKKMKKKSEDEAPVPSMNALAQIDSKYFTTDKNTKSIRANYKDVVSFRCCFCLNLTTLFRFVQSEKKTTKRKRRGRKGGANPKRKRKSDAQVQFIV